MLPSLASCPQLSMERDVAIVSVADYDVIPSVQCVTIPLEDIVLKEVLGSGSFARVSHATWGACAVAVKQLLSNDCAVAIEAESRLLARLHHPSIVKVFGLYALPPSPTVNCLVLDVCGQPLGAWLKRLKPRRNREPHSVACVSTSCFHACICEAMSQIASALTCCHSQTSPIVHCDVKPNNIVVRGVTPDIKATLIDFGSSACLIDRPRSELRLRGTARYLSPEGWSGDSSLLSPASDVYSFGASLIAAFCGSLRWDGQPVSLDVNSKQGWEWIRAAVQRGQLPLLPTPSSSAVNARGTCPDDVHHIIKQCLCLDPTKRPSAREVATVLSHAAQTLRQKLTSD